MRRMLTTTTTLAALMALAAPLLAMAPAAAAQTIEIKPGKIARGPDIAVPYLDGTTVVDGDVTVALHSARALLYGKYHDEYVVATGNDAWDNVRVWRVTASGTKTLLVKGIDPFETILDAEAGQVAYSYGDATSKPTVAVYDIDLAKEVNVQSFASLPTLLDFDEGVVVASIWNFTIKTVTWDTVADQVVKVSSKMSNYASKAHDLLGFYSKDPYQGGCQVLAHLSDPTDVLWTNCDERIEAVSPDGNRVATIALLSDGIGPADVMVRKIGGAPLVHYSIQGWFGAIWWETPTKLLMEANGQHKAATIRCKVAVCDRATALSPTPEI